MATQKSTNRIKATCWAPGMKIEVDGPIVGTIAALFWSVKGTENRKFLADRLAEIETKLSEAERRESEESSAIEPAKPNPPSPRPAGFLTIES